ncbi:MAG: lipoyl synthase, partial [Candidatus Kappaea frigidicola]|nr:lipoyl synthase [Candidatus Kappaea frigidicola]
MNRTLITRKPAWLNKKINLKDLNQTKELLTDLNLNTVCEKALCPNIGECFSNGQATFMILGDVCTRNCRFCGVAKGEPKEVDLDEPLRVAQAVKRLNLKHVVITSVTRDDLELQGADIFNKVVKEIKENTQAESIEVLIPDFQGKKKLFDLVIEAKPDVINHNVETVPALYNQVRPLANYRVSLEVLRYTKEKDPSIFTKSGLMLGLGEADNEVLKVLDDLREVDCDFLTLGQYLNPSKNHYPVVDFITPEKFEEYKEEALKRGFKFVASAPYVRSSYKAREALET